ncbi:Antiviral helicase ski2 [Rachicladosporium monterosium]|uniref:Antiviral helicase ski2 n=1 Tax=Rachicladosporium monterosium TaxID=1507873 RepID=A0ABR0LBL9_9PEZI|nr:Antiviral helicase ski2 [Rachicladosporium monterosium]
MPGVESAEIPSMEEVTTDGVENDSKEQSDVPGAPANGVSNKAANETTPRTAGDGDEKIAEVLLPLRFPALAPHGPLATARDQHGGREWAHMVDVNHEMTNFHELVPEMARTWPFELDTFQKQAVYHLEEGDSVFVAAHTSAGKTVVAEYAMALAAKHMTKTIYTSPIKALSNQKFRDFRNDFEDVGILTGDVQIRPEASCLIMTTEILRSMLYRGADVMRDVEFVVFDEVHYVNDSERGVVWEEVIIMLPEHVTLICLSATVPNTYEFASWIGRTKKKDIYVISTPKRPVPLEHYLWADKKVFKIVDANKQWIEKGWKDANDAMSGRDKLIAAEQKAKDKAERAKEKEDAAIAAGRGGRGGGRGQNGRGGQQRGGGNQRGGPQQRGRGQPATRGQGNIARTGRGGGRTTAAQDRNIWVHLVQHLRKEELLPCCIFVFSKKRCEENVDALAKLDYCTATEKSTIHMILEKSLARLTPDDRQLPQILRMRELLGRGIAVHHGGLLPIVKECVEILFAKTLVKVLFATETFAMGLNLPTRTVVFSGFRKPDSKSFRDLLPALKIEEMIKRSFSENATQAALPEHEKQIKVLEADLAKVKREPCSICDQDIEQCHQAGVEYEYLTRQLRLAVLATAGGRRIFQPKRLIAMKAPNGVRTAGVLLGEDARGGAAATFQVLEVVSKPKRERRDADSLPYLPRLRKHFVPLPQTEAELDVKVSMISLDDIEVLTGSHVQIDVNGILKKDVEATAKAKSELVTASSSWTSSTWDELDYGKSLKEISVRTLLDDRAEAADFAQSCACIDCPDFPKHYAMEHDVWVIQDNISTIRQLMSDKNLQLLPDYQQRILVLKDLGFIDAESRVELKGKVACEIHSADELILTELILENVLADYEPEEIVALLSSFVFQEKTEWEPNMTPALSRGQAAIIKISEKINEYQTMHQVWLSSEESDDFESKPRFGLVEVVYEWARGMPFSAITELTDVLEGTIVRVITRLNETCREVENAATIIGDPGLVAKMQRCQEMIKRDIIATTSLYM